MWKISSLFFPDLQPFFCYCSSDFSHEFEKSSSLRTEQVYSGEPVPRTPPPVEGSRCFTTFTSERPRQFFLNHHFFPVGFQHGETPSPLLHLFASLRDAKSKKKSDAPQSDERRIIREKHRNFTPRQWCSLNRDWHHVMNVDLALIYFKAYSVTKIRLDE